MKLSVLLIMAILGSSIFKSSAVLSLPGMYGQTVSGSCLVTHPFIQNMQNTANLGAPLAVVQDGPEFNATFNDGFSQQWQCSVDFLNDYRVVFQFSSPNPNANIGSGQLIQWHFSEFAFELGDLQKTIVPSFPYDDQSIPSFDADNIWMGFSAFTAYAPMNSYTYQLLPVPEPQLLPVLLVGGLVFSCLRHKLRNGNSVFSAAN